MQTRLLHASVQSNLRNSSGTAFSARLKILTRYLTPLLTRHATHIVTGVIILLLDLVTSPLLMFPILFVLPVALSAWFCSPRLAYVLAVLLPLGRALIATFADLAPSVAATAANGLPFTNLPTSRPGHWGEGVTTEEMNDYIWLRPEILAEIKFAEWTHGEVLRHAEFVSLRDDKEPREVVRETVS